MWQYFYIKSRALQSPGKRDTIYNWIVEFDDEARMWLVLL